MKTVLVIEDEAQTRNMFLRCLEFEGFAAFGANDGSQGITLAQTHQPDLVVCDIMMPDMDGYSVLSTLRRSPITALIPLIFLTAKVTMADLRQGMELGADDYLTKPCTIEQFLAAIITRLNRHDQINQLYNTASRSVFDTSNSANSQAAKRPDSAEHSAPSSIFPNCPKLDHVFCFIEANYHKPITLNDVAQAAGYSPAYLTNLTQELTGHTIKQWIIERRMTRAKHLIKATTHSIRKIAELSGYSDAGYFTRQFRQLHGVSPLAWRQQSVAELTD
ncbi:MAG: response regulator [Kaiparowitsia implicata GSE-PSE-MK54-09C]|jgi:YesN/AraC family two-component response regulator|nr:response regulator [Kaiparowitsia implicata GSE-PSE-MK54-09C]